MKRFWVPGFLKKAVAVLKKRMAPAKGLPVNQKPDPIFPSTRLAVFILDSLNKQVNHQNGTHYSDFLKKVLDDTLDVQHQLTVAKQLRYIKMDGRRNRQEIVKQEIQNAQLCINRLSLY